MRIRRGFLFWGLFLIPLGAIPLLVRGGYLSEDLLTNAWQLWPLILIGLGLALLLGRSQAGLIGTVVVALTLGGLAGAALASGPGWIGSITECAGPGGDMDELDTEGTFDYLFVNRRTGKPYVNIMKVWSKLRRKAGLEHVRIHDLRHQYASFLVNGGRSLYEVQAILGHSDPSVTQRYAHLSTKSLQEAANSASVAMRGKTARSADVEVANAEQA